MIFKDQRNDKIHIQYSGYFWGDIENEIWESQPAVLVVVVILQGKSRVTELDYYIA